MQTFECKELELLNEAAIIEVEQIMIKYLYGIVNA